jgi:hypothetical protein
MVSPSTMRVTVAISVGPVGPKVGSTVVVAAG